MLFTQGELTHHESLECHSAFANAYQNPVIYFIVILSRILMEKTISKLCLDILTLILQDIHIALQLFQRTKIAISLMLVLIQPKEYHQHTRVEVTKWLVGTLRFVEVQSICMNVNAVLVLLRKERKIPPAKTLCFLFFSYLKKCLWSFFMIAFCVLHHTEKQCWVGGMWP